MLDLNKIGKFLAQLRCDKNLSQQELADTIYVTHQAVSKWENGKSIPNIEIMATLTKLYGITIDQLLNGGEKLEDDDFCTLLNKYPREIIINQLLRNYYPHINIVEVLYLMSKEERELIIGHIIKNNISINLTELFPYLNCIERLQLINAISNKKIYCDLLDLYPYLSQNERQILKNNYGGIYEY